MAGRVWGIWYGASFTLLLLFFYRVTSPDLDYLLGTLIFNTKSGLGPLQQYWIEYKLAFLLRTINMQVLVFLSHVPNQQTPPELRALGLHHQKTWPLVCLMPMTSMFRHSTVETSPSSQTAVPAVNRYFWQSA